jgi:hypothetical protein
MEPWWNIHCTPNTYTRLAGLQVWLSKADDFALLTTGKFPRNASELMEIALNILQR